VIIGGGVNIVVSIIASLIEWQEQSMPGQWQHFVREGLTQKTGVGS